MKAHSSKFSVYFLIITIIWLYAPAGDCITFNDKPTSVYYTNPLKSGYTKDMTLEDFSPNAKFINFLKQKFTGKKICSTSLIKLSGEVEWFNSETEKKLKCMNKSVTKFSNESLQPEFMVDSKLLFKIPAVDDTWREFDYNLDGFFTHEWIASQAGTKTGSPLVNTAIDFWKVQKTSEITVSCGTSIGVSGTFNPSAFGCDIGNIQLKAYMFLGRAYNKFWIKIIKSTETSVSKDLDPKTSEVPEKIN